MADKVLTVQEKLEQLFALQKIDSKIDEIQVLKGELPIEVEDLEDEITGLEKRIAKLEETVGNIATEISNHKANIKNSEALIERYNKQLDDVKNNREFDALTKEIELQKLDIQLSEKKIGEVNSAKVAKDEVLTEAQEKLATKQGELETKKVELDKIIAKTDKEEASLNKKSTSARKAIEERLLNSYDRIRARYRNGLSVVTIERDACGGCYNRLPPQMQIEIGMRKNIMACEHCGRVLIDEILAGKKEAEPA